MSLYRCISNDMKYSLEILLTTLNRYMVSQFPEDNNLEYEGIDSTKEKVDVNKMPFVWRKTTEKYWSRLFRKACSLIEQLITFFNEEQFP